MLKKYLVLGLILGFSLIQTCDKKAEADTTGCKSTDSRITSTCDNCATPCESKTGDLANDISVKTNAEKIKVVFVELGSVNCIPCKQMQPVMKAVEEKYAGKVKVIFYDVWTDAGKPYAQQYKIRVIPTQVFLDENGKEFFRHEGFFPLAEIEKLLKEKGIQ
ncbi:MAG: thioredoxin family protein [Candidatus Neomarinimicrobiota bacterium]